MSSKTQKYKIILFEESDTICGGVLSQGVAFCVRDKCRIKHRSKSNIKAIPGNLYILKNNETTFATPTLTVATIHEEVLESWFSQSQTLQAWTKVFGLAEETLLTQSIATHKNLKEEKKEMKLGRIYQTPKKPKLEGILNVPPLSYPPLPVKEEGTSGVEHSAEIVKHFDETLRAIYEEVSQLRQQHITLQNQLNSSSQSFDIRIKDVGHELGTKPAELTQEYDAPNVWSAVGNLAEIVAGMNTKSVRVLSEAKVKKMIEVSRSDIMGDIKQDMEPLSLKCNKVKSTLLTVSKNLKTQIDTNAQGIYDVANHKTTGGNSVDFSGDIARLDNILGSLELDTETLLTAQGEGINFNNMGFRSKKDSDAWIETYTPGGNFDFLVDFHTMMEHINHNITGVDALKQLQNVYKLKLSTLSEALSVTSFEANVPRFLSKAGAHSVVGNEAKFQDLQACKESRYMSPTGVGQCLLL